MKILVTGSSGFIGSHLSQLLHGKGHTVIGYDKLEPAEDFKVSRHITGDILDKNTLTAALEGVDAVVHLAAIHFDFGHEPEEYWEGNEQGTRSVVECMSEAGVRNLVFTSTIAVYGDRLDTASEATDSNPTSPYGASKLAAEGVVQSWVSADPSRRATVIRPCVVYGERNVANMNNLIRQIDSGFFVMFGQGRNIKAIAYVGNVVEVLRHFVENGTGGVRTFNYSDQPDCTVDQIVRIIRKALGKSERCLHLPIWLGRVAAFPFDVFTRVTGRNLGISTARVLKLSLPTMIDSSRIRAAGVKQAWTTEEGLQRTTRYFLQAGRG